jgi:hypothetical protein
MSDHSDSAERRSISRRPGGTSYCRLLGEEGQEAQVREISASGFGLLA